MGIRQISPSGELSDNKNMKGKKFDAKAVMEFQFNSFLEINGVTRDLLHNPK